MRPYIVGNWKMNGSRAMLSEARAIDRAFDRYPQVDIGLAPPYPFIAGLREAAEHIAVGGQDCHTAEKGAHTGDVSAAMLADAGADFVILGHSERRADHGEKDALIKAKAEAALAAGLSVILCVGETEGERDAGKAEQVVSKQLAGSLPDAFADGKLAVAYEPVWAIGTGRVPSEAEVEAMHSAVREALEQKFGDASQSVRILYGGSVNGGNAAALLAVPGVDGALVGGASLTAEAFLPIIAAAADIEG